MLLLFISNVEKKWQMTKRIVPGKMRTILSKIIFCIRRRYEERF